MGKEFEIKFHMDSEEQIAQVLSSKTITSVTSEPWTVLPMHTKYYDTPARVFAMMKWTFRHRREGTHQIVCLKTPSDQKNARSEYEIERDRIDDAAIDALEAIGAPKELRELLDGQCLLCVCSAEFTRQVASVTLQDGTVASVSADAGVLCGSDKRIPFYELEVEFVSGSEEQMLRFTDQLKEEFHLHIEPLSKFVRAAML